MIEGVRSRRRAIRPGPASPIGQIETSNRRPCAGGRLLPEGVPPAALSRVRIAAEVGAVFAAACAAT